MRGAYLSQLDHVFVNILPAILLDLSPSAAVLWQLGDFLGKASDHTPLSCFIGTDYGNRVTAVPRWVPKHPDVFCQLYSALYRGGNFAWLSFRSSSET